MLNSCDLPAVLAGREQTAVAAARTGPVRQADRAHRGRAFSAYRRGWPLCHAGATAPNRTTGGPSAKGPGGTVAPARAPGLARTAVSARTGGSAGDGRHLGTALWVRVAGHADLAGPIGTPVAGAGRPTRTGAVSTAASPSHRQVAEHGSQTTEYALVLIVAATITMLAITWAKQGAIRGVLDGVVGEVLALFGIGAG